MHILEKKDYKDVIVNKPWGHEYLAYQNENLGIWLLRIDDEKQTSMHCHPKKNTGLICLDGNVQVSFLKNSITLRGLDKIMIFRGRFHSTKALTSSFVLEVECPQDKHDLVRLEDKYGRTHLPYEGNKHERAKSADSLWLDDPVDDAITSINLFNCNFVIKNVKLTAELHNRPYEEVLVVLRGGLTTPSGDVIIQAGDVVAGHTMSFLSTKFGIMPNTTLLSINRISLDEL